MPDPSTPLIAAFIFDMDDTLARTAPLWREAEDHLLRELGATWSEKLAAKYKGMNALDVAATIHRELQPALAVAPCQRIMRDRLIAAFERGDIEPIDGATELVRRCAATGRPMAVASGSPMPGITITLGALGIGECFDVTISSESVARGKPHPDVFFAAADKLGVAPEACMVFEDSLIGAQAAKATGMRCAVRPSTSTLELSRVADQIVTRWDDAIIPE